MRFGRFELQPAERRLLADGQPVHLGARAFDLLATLAARPDHLVTKDELLDLVWPGLVVEESNLHTQMSALRRVLGGDVIATVPGRGYRFTAAVVDAKPRDATAAAVAPVAAPGSASASASASAAIQRLPSIPGRLVGRQADLDRVETELRAPGCVTIVGAGGVGKTRLALAAAERWHGRRIWVDMAPLTAGAQIAGALARALGQPAADDDADAQLLRALGNEPALLVLDNAEHLIDACAALAGALVRDAPNLHLLVTSQLALGVRGERVLRTEPLPLESDGAIELLAERIAAADRRVRLDAEATPLLREICRQLDGLPLALEMAAARVPLLGIKGVHDELAQRFALLTTGYRHAAQRHRTLHAALDWSFGLLAPDERDLFAKLGVFAGGFTLEPCVALIAGNASGARWEVIDRLAALVDRSLVSASGDDPPRYRLLETMRAYALEKLDESGATSATRRRHAEVLLEFMVAHTGTEAGRVLCLAEIDNIREAIEWTRRHAPELAVELATLTTTFTTFSPWRGQAHAWMAALQPLMESAQGESLPLERRVAYWNEYARISIGTLQKNAHDIARKARPLARELGDPLALFMAATAVVRSAIEPGPEVDEACAELLALEAAHPEWPPRRRLATKGTLAMAAFLRGDAAARLAFRQEELAIARDAGLAGAAEAAESNVVAALTALGRHDEALALSTALVDRLVAAGGERNANLAWAWDGLVCALLRMRRVDEARARIPAALAACREFGLPIGTLWLPELAALRGHDRAAAQLVGHSRRAYEDSGLLMTGDADERLAVVMRALRERIATAELDALVHAGRLLDERAAVALACD